MMPAENDYITMKAITEDGEIIPVNVYTKEYLDSTAPLFGKTIASKKESMSYDDIVLLKNALAVKLTDQTTGDSKVYYLDSVPSDQSSMTFISADRTKKAYVSVTDGTIETTDL